jgi:hypothetical protein
MGQLRLLGEPPASDDHAALANLAFPQAGHTGFVATAGLAGGQIIIGGTAAGESLSLQSTAHAARGVVQVIDALRLASGLVQDSGGNARVALATASPHLTLTGDVRVSPASGIMAHVGVAPANPQADTWLNIGGNLGSASGTWRGLNVSPQLTAVSPYASTLHGVYGNGTLIVPSGASGITRGLEFTAVAGGQGSITEMEGVWAAMGSILGSSCSIAYSASLYARSSLWMGAKPTRNYGLYVEPQGAAGMTDAVGVLVDAPAGATNSYTIWAGAPITGTPRLRLDAGTPGANQTMLWLAEGTAPTLRRVQWKQFQLLSALDRVMVLV